jgi:glycosyltransferase involved in cell wall biosynthesis
MCDIYGETSVLVVPTTIDETFGRVVVEAQLNGIPVLASDRGALPDVVGGGGAVLAVEKSIELWSSTLKRLLDPQRYAQLSAAAVVNASRFDFTRSICRFASLVDTMLDQGHAANG